MLFQVLSQKIMRDVTPLIELTVNGLPVCRQPCNAENFLWVLRGKNMDLEIEFI